MSEQKIKQIRALCKQVFFLNSAEIDEYLQEMEFFPEEGLDKFIKMLEEAKVKQDEILAKRIEQDRGYADDLKKHVIKSANTIKKKFETAEQNKAEDILKDL